MDNSLMDKFLGSPIFWPTWLLLHDDQWTMLFACCWKIVQYRHSSPSKIYSNHVCWNYSHSQPHWLFLTYKGYILLRNSNNNLKNLQNWNLIQFSSAVVLWIWALWRHFSGFLKSAKNFTNSMSAYVVPVCTLPTSDLVSYLKNLKILKLFTSH